MIKLTYASQIEKKQTQGKINFPKMIFDASDLLESTFHRLFNIFAMIAVSAFVLVIIRKLHSAIWQDKIDVSGKYVLITGCDTGFGYDTALTLSQQDLYVFAGCLTQDGVVRLNNDSNFNGNALLMDICNYDNVDNVKKIIEEKVGNNGLWGLINNAGVNQLGPIEWVTIKQMQKVMDINLWGLVNVTKTLLPLIKKAEGRVINMSSILGRTCNNNLSSYCMSKFAIEAFSDCLRYEMKAWNVTIHVIEPGFHATPFASAVESQWDQLWSNVPRQMQEDYGDYYRKDCILNLIERSQKIRSDPKNVIKAYCHAIVSTRPKLRYVVGIDARTVGMLMATLPTSMSDFLRGMLIKTVVPAAMKKH